MARREYYVEALADSLGEHGVSATLDQIEAIGGDIYHAREMEAEAFGDLCIPNPLRNEIEALASKLNKQTASTESLEDHLLGVIAFISGVDRSRVYLRNGRVGVVR